MQYIEHIGRFIFLPVASNDNDDLLAVESPHCNLAFIRSMKREMQDENAHNGLLLRSRKKRRFFQEIQDAENYILMRYFSPAADSSRLNRLKRHILDRYLFPR